MGVKGSTVSVGDSSSKAFDSKLPRSQTEFFYIKTSTDEMWSSSWPAIQSWWLKSWHFHPIFWVGRLSTSGVSFCLRGIMLDIHTHYLNLRFIWGCSPFPQKTAGEWRLIGMIVTSATQNVTILVVTIASWVLSNTPPKFNIARPCKNDCWKTSYFPIGARWWLLRGRTVKLPGGIPRFTVSRWWFPIFFNFSPLFREDFQFD